MSKTIFKVEITAGGTESEFFYDYASALEYYNKLKEMGLDPELEQKELECDFDEMTSFIPGKF